MALEPSRSPLRDSGSSASEEVGSTVEVVLRGKVARVRQSGTFDIELADGKTIEHAPRNSLSDVAPGATLAPGRCAVREV